MSTWDRFEVAAVQAAAGLDPDENRGRLDALTPVGADLVVFPEVFQRDFGPITDDLAPYAETLAGPFATEVARVAGERDCHLVAGMIERADDTGGPPYNTLLAADGRAGTTARYRKIHLYDSFGYRESDRLSPGPPEPVVVDMSGVPVGLMTCYDLRFPEIARALVDAGAEILVLPAAWVAGERKVDHWRTLIRARAIENTVFVVAAGQPAPRYSGHSLIVDPMGDVVAEADSDEGLIRAVLERDQLARARATNPSLLNRRM